MIALQFCGLAALAVFLIVIVCTTDYWKNRLFVAYLIVMAAVLSFAALLPSPCKSRVKVLEEQIINGESVDASREELSSIKEWCWR